ncbi:uncharacterized protein LOC134210140 [Armigeres subalbatus]|uniref:uncharacterized protein LOC134210140 n=1 Tax=Armigeres subalbatus TaxID=124917 RepID=UPI002ED5B59B
MAFISTLKRFTGRRGIPEVIMCDNATNFVGARRKLDELQQLFMTEQAQKAIVSTAADKGIEFRFIPPKSPNFGGLWEAAVKSMKHHLRRTIGLKIVTPDELETILVQIEACLNSRPLTPLSNDPGDMDVLTPGHFLIQRPLVAIPEPSVPELPDNQLPRWKQTQAFDEVDKEKSNLSVGTMVLIKEDNMPPLKWLLGRVVQIHAGADGNIRVVAVKTKDGRLSSQVHGTWECTPECSVKTNKVLRESVLKPLYNEGRQQKS